jgi:hypothetical protein
MKQIIITLLFLSLFHYGFSQIKYDDGPIINSSNFVTRGSWGRSNITFSFANGTNDIANDDERIAIRQAFQIWADYGSLNFTEVTSNADIEISWQVGVHGDGTPLDGTNGVLAHAFFPPPNGSGTIAGDIHFDDDETWTLADRPTPSGQPIDLVTVAAHEIGHALGLNHSNVACALMNPFYYGSHRYLAQDDIDGIRSIYGNRTAVRTSNLNCSGGTFFFNNVPVGATVFWTSSNTAIATIVNNSNQGIVTRFGSANGNIRITGTITLPCGTSIIEFIDVQIGTPTPSLLVSVYCPEAVAIISNSLEPTNFTWTIETSTGTQTINNATSIETFKNIYSNAYLCVTYDNACGTSYPICNSFDCSYTSEQMFAASPNPTTGDVQVEIIDKDKTTTRKEIQVTDKFGNLKKKIKLNGNYKKIKINIAELPADIYIFHIYDGKKWASKKVIKN